MEHVNLRIPRLHAFQERVHGRLVIVRREARAQPQPEAPAGHPPRPAREPRVAPQHVFGRRAVDEVPLEALALDARLHAAAALAADLELDAPGVVDEHAVAARAQPERDVLVRLVARGAPVGVPQRDRLPYLVEGPEALPEPVHRLPDAECRLREDVVLEVPHVARLHRGARSRVVRQADAAAEQRC